MKIIEKLGGYDAAKRFLDAESYSIEELLMMQRSGLRPCHVKKALQEHRRENNIFEVGDSVVLINGDTDLVHYLSGWYIEGLDFRYTTKTNNRGLWGVIVKSNMPNFWRHATPEEITAGYRL